MKQALLNNMRRVRIAQASIRKSLKLQEAENQIIRANITNAWNDRSRDHETSVWCEQLAAGRNAVRGYQIALHELKQNVRTYNKRYDRIMRRQ